MYLWQLTQLIFSLFSVHCCDQEAQQKPKKNLKCAHLIKIVIFESFHFIETSQTSVVCISIILLFVHVLWMSRDWQANIYLHIIRMWQRQMPVSNVQVSRRSRCCVVYRTFISTQRLGCHHLPMALTCQVHGCLMSRTMFHHRDQTFMVPSTCTDTRHHLCWHLQRRHRQHGDSRIFHSRCLCWISLQHYMWDILRHYDVFVQQENYCNCSVLSVAVMLIRPLVSMPWPWYLRPRTITLSQGQGQGRAFPRPRPSVCKSKTNHPQCSIAF